MGLYNNIVISVNREIPEHLLKFFNFQCRSRIDNKFIYSVNTTLVNRLYKVDKLLGIRTNNIFKELSELNLEPKYITYKIK